MANKTPVWFEAGFGVYSGDDTIHHNYTDSTGNVITLQKGGGGNEVLQVLNKGELKVKSVTGAASAAVTIDAIGSQDLLTLNDSENSDHLLTVRKVTSGSGWMTDFKVRDSGAPSNDDIAVRITHDIQTNSPPLGADLCSMGYTNAAEAYQELFRFKQSGDLYLVGSSGADLLWATTGGGNIGGAGGNSPDNIYGNTSVDGGGTTVKAQTIEIGPTAANTKTITAMQTGTNDPGIRYNSSTSTWQGSNNGTDWTNIYLGAGNDLDEAYNAFGGAGAVGVDAGTLTWTLTSPYDFVIADASNTYFQADTSTGILALQTNAASATIKINALGTTSQINMSSTSIFSVDAGGGISLDAAGVSNFTTSSSNLNLGCLSGTMNQDMLTWDVVSRRAINIVASNDEGNYGFNLENKGASICYVRTTGTNGRSLSIYANTASTLAHLTIASGGNTTVNCARNLNLNVGTAAYDMTLFVPTHANSDIRFSAHGSGNVPFNAASPDNVLVGYTATSIIGALNEVKTDVPTWDAIYASDQTLTIDGSALAFTQTSTSGFGFTIQRNLASGSTNSAIVGIDNLNASDDQEALVLTSAGGPVFTAALLGAPTGTVAVATSSMLASGALGASSDVSVYKASITPNASDNGSAVYRGFNAVGSATGSANKYAFYSDVNWDYGLYSLAPTNVTLSSATSPLAHTVSVTSGGITSGFVLSIFDVTLIQDATDTSTINGVELNLTPDALATSETRGLYVDGDWTYGLYSKTKSLIDLDAVDASVNALAIDVASGGISTASQTINLIDLAFTEHSSDSGSPKINGINIALTPDASSTAVTTGIKIDSDWDLGLSSTSPGKFSRTSLTDSYDALTISISSGGLGSTPPKTVQLIDLAFAEHADDDTADIFGINIALTPDAGANNNDTRAINVDANWNFGVYSLSKSYFNESFTTTGETIYSLAASSTLGAAQTMKSIRAIVNGHASDSGSSFIYGVHVDGTTTGAATKYGLYVDTDWDYGFYVLTKSLINDTLSDTGNVLTVEALSGTLAAAELLVGVRSDVEGHASDNATAQIMGFYAEGSITGSAPKIGFYADGNWDVGLYSVSKAYVVSTPTGSGSLEDWATESYTNPSGNLLSNDEVAAYKATISDAAGDGGAFYYGLYITTSDAGPATKWGIHVDTTWPADQYVMRIRSGLWYLEEDFGTVTTDSEHVDINLSGLLNSTNEGRAINLDITPDPSQADGSRWIGVRARMANTNANDTIGSIAFEANANWHYGLYVDNDLSVQQAPSEGTIHVASTSSSLVGSGTFYGNSYYHTRHASDSGGALNAFYAQANSATGNLNISAFVAGNACNVGVYSEAGSSSFSRGASDWTSITSPVLGTSNLNASNAYAALKVSAASTGSTGKCLEIDHSYSSSTEGSRRAIVFTSASTNRRMVNIASACPDRASDASGGDYYFNGATTLHYWQAITAGNGYYISIPFYLPHNAVIKTFAVRAYGGGGVATGVSLPYIEMYYKTLTSSSITVIGSRTYASGTANETIVGTTTTTVDNTVNQYGIRYRNVSTGAVGQAGIYGAYIDYEITDFGAACGW